MELPAEPALPGEPRLEASRLPALARYWWLTTVRGLVAGLAAVVGALLVLLRHGLAGLVGVSAVLTGVLRVLGGFAAEKQLGRRWTIGGVVLGTVEAALGVLLLVSTEIQPEVIWPVAAA